MNNKAKRTIAEYETAIYKNDAERPLSLPIQRQGHQSSIVAGVTTDKPKITFCLITLLHLLISLKIM